MLMAIAICVMKFAASGSTAFARSAALRQAFKDHCIFQHVERSPEHAHFKVESDMLQKYIPYYLLPYGKAIQILEPEILKERLISVARQ
jgi:predicted DNA-binding transcriptional regulator YafY